MSPRPSPPTVVNNDFCGGLLVRCGNLVSIIAPLLTAPCLVVDGICELLNKARGRPGSLSFPEACVGHNYTSRHNTQIYADDTEYVNLRYAWAASVGALLSCC